MQFSYSKMNSHGNDFVIIDNTYQKILLSEDLIKKISSRDKIGCDQVLLIDVDNPKNVHCKIYNQDGSEAYQCGNGMRAIMSFLNKHYDYREAAIVVNDIFYEITYHNDSNIQVNMGSPNVLSKIPSYANTTNVKISNNNFYYTVDIDDHPEAWTFSYSPIMLGNFHCVVFSDNCYSHQKKIKDLLYSLYQDMPNISYILNLNKFINKEDEVIKLKVDERGSGWTKSCGSGATATASFVIRYSYINEIMIDEVLIEQEGGQLKIQWKDYNGKSADDIYLFGPTTFEYDGVWNE